MQTGFFDLLSIYYFSMTLKVTKNPRQGRTESGLLVKQMQPDLSHHCCLIHHHMKCVPLGVGPDLTQSPKPFKMELFTVIC